jgi:hypothetical protein
MIELIFLRTDFWGERGINQPFDQLFEIEIIQLFDDLQDFIIQNEISTLNDDKGR